jgi:hypothetical protein
MNTATAIKIDRDTNSDNELERSPIQHLDAAVRNRLRDASLLSDVSPIISNDEIGSESPQMDIAAPSAVIAFPRTTHPSSHFRPLQKWEGFVLEVRDNSFTARLVDQSNPGAEDEEVELSLEEISPYDLTLVAPGAIFYWNIGYETTSSGQRKRSSVIRLRRLPAWSAKDIETAQTTASELYKALQWE